MTDDPELSSWREEWQSLGGGEDFAAALVARATRDGRRLRLSALGEVFGVLVSTSICIALMVRSHGAIDVLAITALILMFNGGWLTYFFTLREGAFGSSGQGTEAFVALTRRRFAIDRRWIQFSRKWTIALVALLIPWSAWAIYRHRDAYRAEPWRGAVGFGVMAAILIGLFFWLRFKERRTIAREAAFEREIARADLE